ncbi:hypothetical protein F4803DRAFT_492472 [Xylaria telfairii]|nr:hypothetical protein F4803DRAFT_492472 [Xylaria telfairii]
MRLRPLLSTAIVLFCADAMAQLVRKGKQASPTELNRLNDEQREDASPKTLYVRQRPTATTGTSQPTTSTPYAVPLTTTFIPPESCNQDQLTMLSSPGYFIWLHEPVPVPGTTVSDCYPPEFMSYYKPYRVNPTTVGSMVPLMSPLVCPFGWQAVITKADYQACCPVGYMLTPPETLLDPNRPAYGGTCYSQWPLSSSAYVEVFGSASASGTVLITASTSGFANYAHVIDGIVVSTSAPTSSRSGSPSSQESAQSGGSGNSSLSSGAIAGIVVGVVAAVALFSAGIYVFARRRHRQAPSQSPPTPPPPPPKDEVAMTAMSSTVGSQSWPSHSAEVRSLQTNYSEMPAESHLHELDAGLPTEKP